MTMEERLKKCLIMFYGFEELVDHDYGAVQRELPNIEKMNMAELKNQIIRLYDKHEKIVNDPKIINQDFWQQCLEEITKVGL